MAYINNMLHITWPSPYLLTPLISEILTKHESNNYLTMIFALLSYHILSVKCEALLHIYKQT